MQICSEHDNEDIAYAGSSCPACTQVDELETEIDALEDEVKSLTDELAEKE